MKKMNWAQKLLKTKSVRIKAGKNHKNFNASRANHIIISIQNTCPNSGTTYIYFIAIVCELAWGAQVQYHYRPLTVFTFRAPIKIIYF